MISLSRNPYFSFLVIFYSNCSSIWVYFIINPIFSKYYGVLVVKYQMLLLTIVNYHPTFCVCVLTAGCVHPGAVRFLLLHPGCNVRSCRGSGHWSRGDSNTTDSLCFFLSVLINFLWLSIKSQNIDGKKTICGITKYFKFTCVTNYTLIIVTKNELVSV